MFYDVVGSAGQKTLTGTWLITSCHGGAAAGGGKLCWPPQGRKTQLLLHRGGSFPRLRGGNGQDEGLPWHVLPLG